MQLAQETLARMMCDKEYLLVRADIGGSPRSGGRALPVVRIEIPWACDGLDGTEAGVRVQYEASHRDNTFRIPGPLDIVVHDDVELAAGIVHETWHDLHPWWLMDDQSAAFQISGHPREQIVTTPMSSWVVIAHLMRLNVLFDYSVADTRRRDTSDRGKHFADQLAKLSSRINGLTCDLFNRRISIAGV